jgi:hypothetical protein
MYIVPQEEVSIIPYLPLHLNDLSSLVFESSFSSKFPGFNPLIMDLIPFTNSGCTLAMTCASVLDF